MPVGHGIDSGRRLVGAGAAGCGRGRRATVGGLWDSLLAKGKAWWITVNSDSHVNYLDQTERVPGGSGSTTAG